MPRLQKSTPATLAGKFGMIQIVARDTSVLLDVQGIERGADGRSYRSHSLATLSRNEAMRLRGLLSDALASVMSVPPNHELGRRVTRLLNPGSNVTAR